MSGGLDGLLDMVMGWVWLEFGVPWSSSEAVEDMLMGSDGLGNCVTGGTWVVDFS